MERAVSRASSKVTELRCAISAISRGKKGLFALLKPLTHEDIGISGSITCSLNKISGPKSPEVGDKVIAYNVHYIRGKGWRARNAHITNSE